MTQPQLDRAVAKATGEHTGTIRRIGFRLVTVPAVRRHRKRAGRRQSGPRHRPGLAGAGGPPALPPA